LVDENPFRFPQYVEKSDTTEQNNCAVKETLLLLDDIIIKMKQNDNQRDNTSNNNRNQRSYDEDDEDEDEDKDEDKDDWLWHKKETFGNIHNKKPSETYDILKKRYQSFITKLPFCVPFDLGFMVDINFPDADKFCLCPCQATRFVNFHTIFQIDPKFSWTCPGTQKFTPHGLYQHLQARIDDNTNSELQKLHHLAKQYIDTKYDEYSHNKKTNMWYKHEALD
jgi:hypothetical protein